VEVVAAGSIPPIAHGEMFMAPDSTRQVLWAGVYFSSDGMDKLGLGSTDNRGEEFSVSESTFPDPQLFVQPVAGTIVYNSFQKEVWSSSLKMI